MMNKRGKGKSATGNASQLDLFSSPAVTPSSRQVIAPVEARVAPTSGSVDALSERKTVDPLIAFVLGSARGRGRPEKPLAVDAGEVSDLRRLLDVREAAARLGLSKSTLDKMRCSGRGPRFIRATDRAIRYDPVDLQAFADERRRRSTSDLAGILAT